MLARKLVAVGAVLGVLTVTGVAFSGQGANVTLMSFDATSELLATWDVANNQVGLFKHGEFTAHLPGIISHIHPNIPPDPCDGLIHAYNAQVRHIEIHGTSSERRTALFVTITLLSAAHCTATIDSDAQGNLLSFQPHH